MNKYNWSWVPDGLSTSTSELEHLKFHDIHIDSCCLLKIKSIKFNFEHIENIEKSNTI